MNDFAASMKKLWTTVKEQSVRLWKLTAEKVSAAAVDLKTKFNTDESGKQRSLREKILTGVGLTLCVVFSFLLICNLVIIIKGSVAPEKPPSVLGITPMVVLSGSMSGDAEDHIETGDLIFVGKADPDELEVGDVIAFMEGKTTVTHRIIRIETAEDGTEQWITKGDANNTEDQRPVTADQLVGIYRFRLPKIGDFALFLQQPVGMLIFIGIPCLAFLIYDILRRQRAAVTETSKTSEMEAELERLRRLVEGSIAAKSVEQPEADDDDDSGDDDDYDDESDEDYDDEDVEDDYDDEDDDGDYDEDDDDTDGDDIDDEDEDE